MKEIHLEQGSVDWLNWRSGKSYVDLFGVINDALDGPRITATAASVCGGDSPFATPHQLWGQMLGLRARNIDENNIMLARGNALEPKARRAYMKYVGAEFEPLCVESTLQPWIAASLDGVDILRSKGVEIKCPISERIHGLALAGEVPSYYYDQIQWQFLASDNQLTEIDFFSYAPKIGFAPPITVYPDFERQDALLTATRLFRAAVISRVPLSGSEFSQAASAFLVLNREHKALTAKLEAAKELVKKLADGKPVQGGGIMVTVAKSDGRVSWESVAMNLVERFKVTEDELIAIKDSSRGKPTETVSVKEAPDADGVLAEIQKQMQCVDNASTIDQGIDQAAPAPNW